MKYRMLLCFATVVLKLWQSRMCCTMHMGGTICASSTYNPVRAGLCL